MTDIKSIIQDAENRFILSYDDFKDALNEENRVGMDGLIARGFKLEIPKISDKHETTIEYLVRMQKGS